MELELKCSQTPEWLDDYGGIKQFLGTQRKYSHPPSLHPGPQEGKGVRKQTAFLPWFLLPFHFSMGGRNIYTQTFILGY